MKEETRFVLDQRRIASQGAGAGTKRYVVQTTGVLRGERVFRDVRVSFDPMRVEWDFVPASASRPAQHRIFRQDYDRGLGRWSSSPMLITGATSISR